jgi:hypothetical protein
MIIDIFLECFFYDALGEFAIALLFLAEALCTVPIGARF